jgi:uncharacterized protein (DUF1697 family)
MKAKTWLLSFLMLAVSFMFTSCDDKTKYPENWMVEIEDSFRAQVTVALAYLLYAEEDVDDFVDKLEAAAEEVDDETIEIADVARYKLALEKLLDKDTRAEEVLEVYNGFVVLFSDFTKDGKEDGLTVWNAQEMNSGIKVTFKNNDDLDWDLDIDPETYQAYVETLPFYQEMLEEHEGAAEEEVEE